VKDDKCAIKIVRVDTCRRMECKRNVINEIVGSKGLQEVEMKTQLSGGRIPLE
jgi:hypothetical protein